jgi:hypothetical protein
MRALVVYESMYGNTATVAGEIAAGLDGGGAEVTLRNVDDVEPGDVAGFDLLVVGGPTHAHGMTRATTRMTAAQDRKNTYDDPTVGDGLRAWLDALIPAEGTPAAAFDTRIRASAVLTGAASKGIAARLGSHGYRLAIPRESFLVTKDNTLVDGEAARAHGWGRQVAASVAVPS